MAAPAQAHTHTGPYQTIPHNASPSLRFLAAFLAAVDSSSPAALRPFLAPAASFVTNGGDAVPAETVLGMMEMRTRRLKAFRHKLKAAWDVEVAGVRGLRMLLYESVSVTVFIEYPEERCVEVAEFSTVELVAVDGDGVARVEG
ncbi:unnamed protein product [Calypogeia fissa]